MKSRTISEQVKIDIERQEDERGLALLQVGAPAFQGHQASFHVPLEFVSGSWPPAPSSPVVSSEDPPQGSGEDPPQGKEEMITTLPPTEAELKEGIIKFKIRLPGGRR